VNGSLPAEWLRHASGYTGLTTSRSIATFLRYKCGHAAMVSLPRVNGEKPRERDRRIALEKVSASQRRCDFCASDASTPELVANASTTDSTLVSPVFTQPEPLAPLGDITGAPESEEPSVTSPTASDQQSPSGRGRSPLRKLSDEQELELTRLYSETETPVPDIARRFGVGESSVYRISQRHGAGLRGRTAADGRESAASTATPAAEQTSAAAPEKRRRGPARGSRRQTATAAAAAPARTARRARTSATGRRAPRQRQPAAGRSAAVTRQARSASSGLRRFRVAYLAEKVIEANSIRDAIAQAEAQGATDITSVTVAT
jgi:transposase-like protein